MRRCFGFLAAAALCTAAGAAWAQPANDHCADAQVITDGDWTYDLTGADTDGPTCDAVAAIGGEDSQDVWFDYTATQTGILNAVTCTNTFSSSVAIYVPGCTGDELASGWIGSVDGPCPFSFAGDASVPVTAGQRVIIKVAVALFGSPAPSVLHVEIKPAATSCVVIPPGAVEEGEPCGQNWNDSCESAFEIPAHPIDVSGTLVSDLPTNDQDWFHVHADGPQLLKATLSCDLPTMIMTIYASPNGACVVDGFDVPVIAQTYMAERCQTGELGVYVGAGDYYIRLLPDTAVGYPCDTVNSYVLHVESTPVGACCLPTGCSLMTEADCAASGGSYQGDGSACGLYTAAPSSSAYEDISATGSPGPQSTTDGPETNLVVNVGFNFSFYGRTYSHVSISTNGFLQFGDNPIAGAPFNKPLPSISGGSPHNAICGLWDALVTTGDEGFYNGSGSIVYQTLGSAPNRRFIAQWINVGQEALFPLVPEGDPVNFEIVLFEGTNDIEFRYGAITADPGQNDGSNDYSVGVQDEHGINGTNVDSTTIGSGNTALLLTFTGSCVPPCPADFDHTGFVDTDDFDAFVHAFEAGSEDADFDGSGFVDTDDFDAFVHAFESGC